MKFNPKSVLIWSVVIFFFSCKEEAKEIPPVEVNPKPVVAKATVKLVDVPAFDENSAYAYIQKQVDFGPRIPNTEAHVKCGNYLQNELAKLGLDTIGQRTIVKAYNSKELKIKNIIASYNPEAKTRLMLAAHWDARPFADRDTKKRAKPFDAANDGASGVGVLLEIARTISEAEIKPQIGFDIILFDAEDYGQPQESYYQSQGNTWCLGAQYWSANLHTPDYSPKYGILLDMVGAANAQFPKEGLSLFYAGAETENIWALADKLGYANYFVNAEIGGGLTDDHKYVNEIAKIPCIDIIHYEVNRGDFGTFHHTHQDNMDIIDKKTLKAVGETLLQVIYQEK